MKSALALSLLACTTTAWAQGWGGDGNGNPWSSSSSGSGSGNGNNDNNDGNPFDGGNNGVGFFGFSHYQVVVTAHAVLACVAFAFLFPVGGIMIRLGSFRGLWIVHGLFQMLAYLLYLVAFGLGLYLITSSPISLNNYHPIIGIVLFVVLFFQPFFGFIHHRYFLQYERRGFFSYLHIWIGRLAITLGMINGGFGLQLAGRFPIAPPSQGAIVGYSVGAAIMWLIYVFSIYVSERRRENSRLSKV